MPLGRQFENTFFEGKDAAPKYYTKLQDSNKEFLKTKPENKDDALFHTSAVTDQPEPGIHYQGMFFDPYAATGHRKDPLVPEEVRKQAFAKALHTNDTEEYTKNATIALGKSYTPTPKRAKFATELINQTAFESGIPTHEIFKIDAKASLYPKQKIKNGGHFSDTTREIVVHEKKPIEKVIPGKVIPNGVKGAPIPNPNFNKDIANKSGTYFSSEHIWQHDLMNTGNRHVKLDLLDEKGVPYKWEGSEKENHDLTNLPKGHSVNVWPGKGEDTDKYIVTPFKIEGRGRVSNRYGDIAETYRTFHTRHERIPTEGTKTLFSTVKNGPSKISENALVHEIGHSLDPHVSSSKERMRYSNPDPVVEATADGYEDRFSHHKDRLQTALEPSARRATEIKQTSYGTNRWKSDTHKALYAAVRQHVSMADNNIHDITSRSQVFEKAGLKGRSGGLLKYPDEKQKASELLLGHLYTHHSHVREVLGHLKLDHIGEKAANIYRSSVTDAGRGLEQPTLPGMNT
jgi:hypothetical protein